MLSMTITNFSKKLIDLQNRITSRSDDFNQKLVNLKSKVTRHSDDIKKLLDTTSRIEKQSGQNHTESKMNHNQTMTILIVICDRMKITPKQII